MKWAFFGTNPAERERMKALSQSLTEKGCDNELTMADWDGQTGLSDLIRDYEHVRWGQEHQIGAARGFSQVSSTVRLLGLSDGFLKERGVWWADCELLNGCSEMLHDLGGQLDSSAAAFIAGTGPFARAAIAALFRCGFRNFSLAASGGGMDLESLDDLKNNLQKNFFDIQLDIVPIEKVVLLPGLHGVLVNVSPHVEANPLINELCYLNFLKRPGVVIDLAEDDSVLLKEARDAGVPARNGSDIFKYTNQSWARRAFGP